MGLSQRKTPNLSKSSNIDCFMTVTSSHHMSLEWLGLSLVPHLRPLRKLNLLCPAGSLRIAQPIAAPSIMASQDQISQFTPASQMIPASQPDRSRTPRRQHQHWHQPAPTFRGPIHYAMAASRPMWHNTGLPPPPLNQTALFSPSRAWWAPPPPSSSRPPFPPAPPILPPGPHEHNPFTPQHCCTTTPKSPPSATPPTGISPIRHGYTCRPCEIRPVDAWKPDVDYHDMNKVNGLDFPARIRQSKFASFKDIEGMDPLQVPLWKFLYQGLQNTWLRRIAYGRETFVLPFDNIGTTVFIAEMVSQLRTRNIDLDKLAAYKSRCSGHNSPRRKPLNSWPRRSPN